MAKLVYLLCALTSIACMVLLFRGYSRTRLPLLLWSGSAFLAFAISNTLLFADLVLFPNVNLLTLRQSITLMGIVLLLYGLIRTND